MVDFFAAIFVTLFFINFSSIFTLNIDSDYLYNTKSKTFIKVENNKCILSILQLAKGKDAFEKRYNGIKTNFKFEIEIILNNKIYVYEISVELTPNRVLVDNQSKMSIIYTKIKIKTQINSIDNDLSIKMVEDIVKEVFENSGITIPDTLIKNIDIKYFLEKNKKAQD
jgi:hypothetical protein